MYERGFPGEPFDVALRYQTIRVWEVPVRNWLEGGLGLLPLAPLGAMQREELPAVIARMKERLGPRVPLRKRKELWSATNILMGLRFGLEETKSLLQGVVEMKESVTYQAILNEGKAKGICEGEVKEARKILLLLGRDQLGEPSANQQAVLDGITDTDRLNELIVRLKHAASWQELLGLTGSRRRSSRRTSN